jgi:hypothetical protein
MTTSNQSAKRVLCLTQPVAGWRTPRAWHWRARVGWLLGGQAKPALQPGAWLLELGTAQVWTGGDETDTEYLYRLPTGQVLALERPLTDGEATEVGDLQAVAAMNAYRGLDQALLEDMGIDLRCEQPGLPPFALIQCPLCGSIEFVSIELASAWCQSCNARFVVYSTSGDPGFCCACYWESYDPMATRYIMPRVESLHLYMVLKNSGNPRDMSYDAGGVCGWRDDCRPDAIGLTDGGDATLRPGLHACRVGDVYEWSLAGRIPSPGELGLHTPGWQIEGQSWPWSAARRRLDLEQGERLHLEAAAAALRAHPQSQALLATAAALEKLEAREPEPYIFMQSLPPRAELAEGEYYLLHRWLVDPDETYRSASAWPVWLVVQPVTDPESRVTGWEVVRRDVCPRCARRVRPEDLAAEGEPHRIPHAGCRKVWERTGWRPASGVRQEEPHGQENAG